MPPTLKIDADLLERRRILSLARVAELTSLSVDSLKRLYPDKIRRLGPRRRGMTVADALSIGEQV
jgi:hypothetical protein